MMVYVYVYIVKASANGRGPTLILGPVYTGTFLCMVMFIGACLEYKRMIFTKM